MSKLLAVLVFLAALSLGSGVSSTAMAQVPSRVKGQPIKGLLSFGGKALLAAKAKASGGISAQIAEPDEDEGEHEPVIPEDGVPEWNPAPGEAFPAGGAPGGTGDPRNYKNVFVNDPCLDPPPFAPFPENFRRTVQSETEIAVFNPADDEDSDDDDSNGRKSNRAGRLMVAGYNDSWGFYDNRMGLSGFAYSTDGGNQWIDASGLPPRLPTGVPAGTLGSDAYFGDPVVDVDNRSRKFVTVGPDGKKTVIRQSAGTFYYASIYQHPSGYNTVSVNRGRFKVAPQQVPIESKSNTRCASNPALWGVPDPPAFVRERIIWEPPVEAVLPPFLGANNDAFLDKEWLYVDQRTGVLYVTYTRFGIDGSTPIELVRSFDGGRTWTPPSVIVPNLDDTFNQATQPIVTPTGRVIVSWHARTFPSPVFIEREQRIEVAFSDDCSTPAPCTFSTPVIVARVNPQGEPPGYNRRRNQILNAPYIMADRYRRDDDRHGDGDDDRDGRGSSNVYITYFNGHTPFAPPGRPNPLFSRAADIYLSTSTTDGTTWHQPQKVNDDNTETSHVFPSVQLNDLDEVFVTWQDRRRDPERNLLTDTWGEISQGTRHVRGTTTGAGDFRITDVSSDWIVRADAAPNFGDYNSSEVIGRRDFVSIWGDGRFPTPVPLTRTPTGGYTRPASGAATPDTMMEIVRGGKGKNDGDRDRDKDDRDK